MSRPPKDRFSGSAQQWIAYAEHNLALARLVEAHPEIQTELYCYHAQQAAEKAIKAVLLFTKAEFPFTHDLDLLLGLVQDAEVEVPVPLAMVGRLTPYATQTRYPGEWEDVSEEELAEALALAEQAVTWARSLTRPGSHGT